MTLNIKSNAKEAAAQIAKLHAALIREAGKIEKRTEKETEVVLIQGIDAGVYSTPAGAYSRTLELRKSAYVTPSGSPGIISLNIGNTSEHASQVEWGGWGNDLNPTQARQLAEPLKDQPRVLYLGRSAANWVAPNPSATRATVFASYRIANEFQSTIKRLWPK